MDDLLSEFLTETGENISVLDLELVKLEQNPNDPALLSNIFRLVHTIKGTCGFLGLPRLEAVAHASENILGKFRDGELTITPASVSLILESLDVIKNLLGILERDEKEPDGNDQDLIDRLNAHAAGQTAETGPAAAEMAEPSSDLADSIIFVGDDLPESVPEDAADAPEPAPNFVTEPSTALQKTTPPVSGKPAPPAASAASDGDHKEGGVAGQSIRVNVDLLENLMTMVSELVLTRNQLLQILRAQKDSEFTAPLQRLNLVTSELQEGVMKTRMQPIGNAWAKLPRIIRDLSMELGKKIDLQMIGAETELDRQVLELIKDPLTHMVRNSADHGIELPAERVRAGKAEMGKIVLNAYHEGGHIIIEIADDGKGLAIDKIKSKVIQNGLASEAELVTMSEQQIYQFIFRPGFSTAAQVTSVSGRGVGMDVVRTNIEKIGGTIDLQSQEGKGSRFLIKIPLTLAIVSALIVECATERFAIPQISIVELVRASARSEHRIENINDTPVLRLRNRLLPLVSLQNLLGLQGTAETKRDETYIAVIQVGANTFGIMVDKVFDTEEIVVKPVAPILRNIAIFSGNTILGDGSVIMILDPNGIAASAGEIAVSSDAMSAGAKAATSARNDNIVSMLLFRAGGTAPKAVPLALVARLEDVDMASVESSNGTPVVQYRGKLMPLVPIEIGRSLPEKGVLPVLVFADGDRSMGLVVDEIVDIVEEKLQVELAGDKPGLMGSAIIAGKATDVIDAGHYLTQAFQDWFGSDGGETFETDQAPARVLLIDDSPFFRNLLSPLLGVAGYDVKAVESGADALALCQSGETFDVIVSDIEMPGMSGFEFMTALRALDAWKTVPAIALSSHATPRDIERGRQVGFTDYIAKNDREALLSALAQHLLRTKGAA
jgi:two-component system, chemotaxis family, sensor kinase CheA